MGALTLGMGVAVLAGGSGVAHADRSNDAAPSKGAGARSVAPARAASHENGGGRGGSVDAARSVAHAVTASGAVTRSIAAVNTSTRIVVTSAVSGTGPDPADVLALAASPVSAGAVPTVRRSLNHAAAVAISHPTAVQSVAAATVRQSPVQAVVGVVVNALVALGGLDPVAPEPAPGNLWQLGFYSVARWLADAVNPGGVPTVATTSVGTPDLETGVVAGRALFSTAAGDPLTYRVSVDPTQGTAAINPDGSYTFTPLQAARLGDGPVTVTMLVTAYHGVQKTTSAVNIPLPKAAFAAPTVIHVGDFPTDLALSPDGTRLVVAKGGSNSISVIDTATNTKVTPDIAVGQGPESVVFTPDGSAVYVVNSGFPANPSSMVRVSLLANAVDTIPVALPLFEAMGPANTPAAGRLYVTTFFPTVSIINTNNNAVLPGTIPVPFHAAQLAVSPDGQHVYVADDGDHAVLVVSTASNTVTATIPVAVATSGFPGALAVTPNGKFLYVTVPGASSLLPGAVWVIDTATNAVKATVTVGAEPRGIAVSPDGSVVYVTNQNKIADSGPGQAGNTVSAISTATNTVIKTITVGNAPRGVAVSPTRLYVANFDDATVSVVPL